MIASEKPQYKVDSFHKTLRPAGLNFGERGNRNSYITTREERIRVNLHYNASEEPQYKVYSSQNT